MLKWIFSFVVFISAQSEAVISTNESPLPNWIDESRENPDHFYLKNNREELTPHENLDFRYPAEYEKHRAVVIGNMGFSSMLSKIIQHVEVDAKTEVWAVNYNNLSYPMNPQFVLESHCPLNTVWMRDYGPFSLKSKNPGEIAIVDSIYRHYAYRRYDDRFPSCLGGEQNINVFKMNLILDGGNLMTDTKGNLFMTKVTYKWNSGMSKDEVDEKLKKFFGVHTIHALDFAGYPYSPKDGTGHIDMFLKLLDDNTFVLAKSEQEPFKTTFKKAYQYLSKLTAPNGKPYKILRLKGWYNRAWYTYTNSLIVNDHVLMPSFSGHESDNELAKKTYELGLSNKYKVIPIKSDSAILYGGSIHCVTQTITE